MDLLRQKLWVLPLAVSYFIVNCQLSQQPRFRRTRSSEWGAHRNTYAIILPLRSLDCVAARKVFIDAVAKSERALVGARVSTTFRMNYSTPRASSVARGHFFFSGRRRNVLEINGNRMAKYPSSFSEPHSIDDVRAASALLTSIRGRTESALTKNSLICIFYFTP